MTSTLMTKVQYPVYKNESQTTETMNPPSCRNAICITFVVVNVIIIILGVAGNALVIWIAGFKVKKSVISTWYLSLAVSDFLYCCFLTINVVNALKKDWIIGSFMCKFRSFMLSLNWYSSIFLLVIITVDRCVLVMFPVWAHNQRTIRKASGIIMVAWIVSAVLSTPMIIFRDIQPAFKNQTKVCGFKYLNQQQNAAVVTSRFIFLFAIPYLIIVICYVIIMRKLKTNEVAKSKKPLKIMTALIVSFLICWLPYHTFSFIRINGGISKKILSPAINLTFTLANSNSCLNPFLYAFMGKDFKKQCFAILSKMENAIEEDGRSTIRGVAVSTSGETNLSTTV
ncbi:chemerin-like receptor 1 [Astyanax mexicanus]|uniref:chemerin-like receptor 1 n=1 Tax=Astyanax mexicanus TaxID=7994 RepID=UPI0020CAD903|nr:chemerin-like receptor 1 [Astyanax mexicanus]